MEKIDLMNKYVANLAILNVKLHNLHWNVTGIQFMPVHKFTEELYEHFFEAFDEVAEQIKILGSMPASRLDEYMKLAVIKEIDAKDFSGEEVLEHVKQDLEHMDNLAREIRSVAESDSDFSTVAIFEEHSVNYEKNLWFLSAMLK